MKRIVFTAIMAIASLAANAQVKVSAIVGPEVNLSLGIRAGADIDIPISDQLSIVPGAYWQLRHRPTEEEAEHFLDGSVKDSEIDTQAHFITIPVRLGIKVYESENGKAKYNVLPGLYAAYGIGGTTQTTTTEQGIKTETSCDAFGKGKRYVSRLDYGMTIGAEAIFNDHYIVGLNAECGFKRIYDPQAGLIGAIASIFPGVSTNLSLGITLGYQF